MQNVVNATSREDATQQAARFLAYFPYRMAWIVEQKSGGYGWFSGKTQSTAKRLVREGYKVFRVMK